MRLSDRITSSAFLITKLSDLGISYFFVSTCPTRCLQNYSNLVWGTKGLWRVEKFSLGKNSVIHNHISYIHMYQSSREKNRNFANLNDKLLKSSPFIGQPVMSTAKICVWYLLCIHITWERVKVQWRRYASRALHINSIILCMYLKHSFTCTFAFFPNRTKKKVNINRQFYTINGSFSLSLEPGVKRFYILLYLVPELRYFISFEWVGVFNDTRI